MATVQYLYAGSGAPVAERRGGTTRAYQFDGMGSTRQMVDSGGSVTDAFAFDLLGNVRSRTGSTPTPFSWNLGAGKTTSPTGLSFQDRPKPGRYGPTWGWGTGWDALGGFDLGNVRKGGNEVWEILNEIISQGGLISRFVVVSGRPTPPPAPKQTPRTVSDRPVLGSPPPPVTQRPAKNFDPLPAPFAGDSGPHGIAFLTLIWCLACCGTKVLAGRAGISVDYDCSPRIESGSFPDIPNPSEVPGPFGNWFDDVIFDYWRKAGFDKEEAEKIIEEFMGQAAKEYFDLLDDWLGKCKTPICFIECAAQFYVDMKEADVNVDPWQGCGYERSADECYQCCELVKYNNRKTDCILACQDKWGE